MSALCPRLELNMWNVRAFYTATLYAVHSGLSAAVVGILDAEQGDGQRRSECALQGATMATPCPPASEDDKLQNDAVFGIAIAVMVVNMLGLLFSILTTRNTKMTRYHFQYGFLMQLVNVGLYVGLLGWLAKSEDFLDEANVEHSVFFAEANPFALVLSGLIFAGLDMLGLNLARWCMGGFFMGKCEIKQEELADY